MLYFLLSVAMAEEKSYLDGFWPNNVAETITVIMFFAVFGICLCSMFMRTCQFDPDFLPAWANEEIRAGLEKQAQEKAAKQNTDAIDYFKSQHGTMSQLQGV